MKILIIDDERSIRNTLKEILEFEGHVISLAEDGASGLEAAAAGNFDVIFCDIKMPGMDGVEVLDKLSESGNEAPVVMISGHGSIDTAVECIKKGAYDFIQKPLDLNRILITLKNATDKSTLVRETKALKKKVGGVQEIIGESPAIVRIKNMIDRVAPTDARVLITGANGTGKELVARWLHEKSDRSSMPFIEVNCAAIPSELIESELFGHEKGAFTGAQKQHKGKFEHKDITVNVRVVAATNKNLREEIAKGNFREDLYHRISVIVIRVPSLAERREDIPLLIDYFIRQICRESGKPVKEIDADAVEELCAHAWSGNIRELHNVVERLLTMPGAAISASCTTWWSVC